MRACRPSPEDWPTDAAGWVVAIRKATEAEQPVVVERFHIWLQPELRRRSARICHSRRLDLTSWGPDIESAVCEAAFRLTLDIISGAAEAATTGAFFAMLEFRAKAAADEMLNSAGGLRGVSGLTGRNRRIRELRATEATLAQALGRAPTPDEVIDATNQSLRTRRSDAVRQGMVCTMSDWEALVAGPAIVPAPTFTLDGIEEAPIVSTDDAIDPAVLDYPRMRQRVLNALGEEGSSTRRKVAEAWLPVALDAHFDQLPTAVEIGNAVGIAPQTARAHIAAIRAVFAAALRESA